MKESKSCLKILSVIVSLFFILIIFLPEKNCFRTLFSALSGGVAVSWFIALITYRTAERNAIYNFYVSADRYVEQLICFSQFLAESSVYFEKASTNDEKQRIAQIVLKRLEKVFDKLYEEYLIIQLETRECEAYHIGTKNKKDIKYYMRHFYDYAKDIVNFIRSCDELNYHAILQEKEVYKKIILLYDKLRYFFLKKDENKFTLIQCEPLDNVLNKFISHGFILYKKDKEQKRNAKYEVINDENNDIFSNGIVNDEFSVCIENRPKNNSCVDMDWFDDI